MAEKAPKTSVAPYFRLGENGSKKLVRRYERALPTGDPALPRRERPTGPAHRVDKPQ